MSRVLIPAVRVERWFLNFEGRHGPATYAVEEGALQALASDGASARAVLPFDRSYAGAASPAGLAAAVRSPDRWGVLLVRKGGFAVARLAGDELVEHKVGQRHVQGRTKAGGQSQQRFARRRDNQARQAYEAAAEHAARILGQVALPVVTGGDHAAVDEVLADPRLRRLVATGPWLAIPDPRRAVLDAAIADARSVRIVVVNA